MPDGEWGPLGSGRDERRLQAKWLQVPSSLTELVYVGVSQADLKRKPGEGKDTNHGKGTK